MIEGAGHRRPAQHRGRGTGGAADDDVLWRGPLEVQGVDDGIADQGEQGQPGSERIDEQVQHDHAQGADGHGEGQALARIDVAGGQRPVSGARHLGVDAAIDQVVDGRGRGGHQPDAQGAEHQHAQRHGARRGQKHADHGREHDQRDDLDLAQRGQVPPGHLRPEPGRQPSVDDVLCHARSSQYVFCCQPTYEIRSRRSRSLMMPRGSLSGAYCIIRLPSGSTRYRRPPCGSPARGPAAGASRTMPG